jgi:effector-binding domain-containing protein
MLDQPRIVQTDAQLAAIIRLTIPREEIRKVMGPGIAELMATIASQGIAPAGPVFSHHLRMDPDTVDFEIGVPVGAAVTAAGRVTPGQLPAARVGRTVYHGPYEGLGRAWAAVLAQ